MLLIFTPQSNTRLQYSCKFIFEEVLGTSYSLTTDKENFSMHTGAKINYSHVDFASVFQIKPHVVLFETGIKEQDIIVVDKGEKCRVFVTPHNPQDFDIFAAVFYLISRYEEYLPHAKDMYGRYAYENSLAYKGDFLHLPLINIWIENFKGKLIELFPSIKFIPKQFSFLPTYDIDIAWSFKEKGILRNVGGFIKSPTLKRLGVLLSGTKDPYDSYDLMNDLHKEHKLNPIYFFLVAKKNGLYDKNILPQNKAMQELIKTHADKYSIGIHPSWQSYNNDELLLEEKEILQSISGVKIDSSRQHYIKFSLPETYRKLIEAGITNDYSMGYGSINGFRASTASPFYWYDLNAEKITSLRIHPFCFMDANCFYEQKLSVEASFTELMNFYQSCKKVNAPFVSIFHNNFLGTDKMFLGWKDLYVKFISQLPQ